VDGAIPDGAYLDPSPCGKRVGDARASVSLPQEESLRERLIVASHTQDVDAMGYVEIRADGFLLVDGVNVSEWLAWAAQHDLKVRVTLKVDRS
jgi:hypothetical protein